MTRKAFLVAGIAVALVAGGLGVAQEEEMPEGFTDTMLQAAPLELGQGAFVQALFEFRLEPGTETGQMEQPQLVAYVLEGTLTVSVNGGPETAYEPGSTLVVEAGSLVSLANRGDTVARALCFAVLPEGALEGE
jgi:quercetin dioxygenase-like cupin family protein